MINHIFIIWLIFGISIIPVGKCLAQQDSIEIIDPIEVWPSFPGGEEALIKYLSDSIVYPQEAIDARIQGTVYASFVVENDGSITNVIIMRGIGGGCDEEAVRVIEGMPKWTPGYQRGIPLRVRFNLPIKFKLPEQE